MMNCAFVSLFVSLLLVVANSFGENVPTNNSYVLRQNIGEGQDDSLHCVTDNSDGCNATNSNWYDPMEGEVHQGPDGNSDLYVTRGDGVVYLNRRRGGQSGMWRCDIPDSNGIQQSIYIYLGIMRTGILCICVILDSLILL